MRGKRVHIGLFALGLAVTAPSAFADASAGGQQDQSRNERRVGTTGVRTMRFRGMDRNRDGVIARAEWRGNDRSFRIHDRNGDNVLSGDELRINGAVGTTGSNSPGRRFMDLDLDDNGRIERDEWRPRSNMLLFNRMDENRDGALTREEFFSREDELAQNELFLEFDHDDDGHVTPNEWHGDRGLFARRDSDRNGSLDRREFLTGDTALVAQDGNNDSVLTREEWHGYPDDFEALDDDGNGVVTRTEFLGRTGNVVTPESPSMARFNDWDHNNNGRIEPGEWHGRSDNFRRLDVNGDGWVSRDEFANRVPPSSREEEFAEFDHNNDGRITRDEWHGDIWAFSRLDVDRNNVVTRAEYLRTGGASVPRWHDWDTNGDGRLSAQEWRGHPEMFRRLDLNRDGWLAREEMPYRGGPREREEEFVEIDRNGDGRITIYEWRGERGEFGRVDTNRDGVITPGEFFENLPATDVNDQAYRRGYDRGREEGMAAGREDRENRNGYDLEGQRELEYANSGYDPRVGSIESYQAGYRAGFREGYSTGYNR